MTGSHRRAVPDRSRLSRVVVPLRDTPVSRARSAIEVTDGYTLVTHQVNDGAIALGRSVGRYRALCGDLVLAASLAEPGRGRCRTCAVWTAS